MRRRSGSRSLKTRTILACISASNSLASDAVAAISFCCSALLVMSMLLHKTRLGNRLARSKKRADRSEIQPWRAGENLRMIAIAEVAEKIGLDLRAAEKLRI